MPLNTYFNNGTRDEQELFEDIVIEAIQIYGHESIYIPRKIVKQDLILNEDLISEFNQGFHIEMYIESVDGFEGDGKLLSRFGLEIRDQITLVVSDRRWNQLVGRYGYEKNTTKPKEGDLVYLPLTKGLFEIKFVEDRQPFFQLGNIPAYKLICELFEYESQEIDTGINAIDEFQQVHSEIFRFVVDESIDRFVANETVLFTLPSGVTGSTEFFKYELTEDDPPKREMVVGPLTFDDGNFHQLIPGTTFTNTGGGNITTILEIYDLSNTDKKIFTNDIFADNSSFAIETQNIIDWSETNPFGEPFQF